MKIVLVAHGEKIEIGKQLAEIAGFLENNGLKEKINCVILSSFDGQKERLLVPENIDKVVMIPLQNTNEIEHLLNALGFFLKNNPYQLLLFGSDDRSRQLAVRLGCRLEGSSCLGVRAIELSPIRVIKRIYSNNVSGRIRLEKWPYCLSVDKTSKGLLVQNTLSPVKFEVVIDKDRQIRDYFRKNKVIKERLENYQNVIIIGNGVEKKDLPEIRDLAKKMNAGLGGSRSAVERGLVSVDKMVGISGKIIAPKLCILIGVSGMAALTGGIEASQLIVAINKDPQAPIFRYAHYGIAKPYQELLEVMLKIYKENKSG